MDLPRVETRMSVMQIAAPAEGELVAYLKALSYEVDWDFRVSLGRWLEVYDGDRMVLQIDEWAPLDDFLECLPGLVELGRHSTEKERAASDWEMRCPNLKDAEELLRRVQRREMSHG